MFLLSKPDANSIRLFLAAQEKQQFSYLEVGASRELAPRGYKVDHNRISLGHGADVFERARHAVRQWSMFDMPWIELFWPDAPIESGSTVGLLVSHFGFWSLNACRIVYVVEEQGSLKRYGFAYGTLPEHAEFGEERFTVEYRREDQSVWYEIYAFSRPHVLSRLAYPVTRTLQKRFAKDSMAAMRKAIDRVSAGRTSTH